MAAVGQCRVDPRQRRVPDHRLCLHPQSTDHLAPAQHDHRLDLRRVVPGGLRYPLYRARLEGIPGRRCLADCVFRGPYSAHHYRDGDRAAGIRYAAPRAGGALWQASPDRTHHRAAVAVHGHQRLGGVPDAVPVQLAPSSPCAVLIGPVQPAFRYSPVKYRYDARITSHDAAPTKRAGRLASAPAILQAATTLFLRNGYVGTSMDEIAALAGVSKQTVYKHFADKERLFCDVVTSTVNEASDPVHAQVLELRDSGDLEADLRDLARRQLTLVLQPKLMQLRRL